MVASEIIEAKKKQLQSSLETMRKKRLEEIRRTPLHHACEEGHLDVVQYLIDDQKVDPSCRDEDDDTPLHIACVTGQLSVVRLLVEYYLCDPGLRDKWGDTPLDIALHKGQAHITSYLSSIQATVSSECASCHCMYM